MRSATLTIQTSLTPLAAYRVAFKVRSYWSEVHAPRPDWRHFDQFSVDQFKTGLWRENSGLCHLVELGDRQPSPRWCRYSAHDAHSNATAASSGCAAPDVVAGDRDAVEGPYCANRAALIRIVDEMLLAMFVARCPEMRLPMFVARCSVQP